MNQRQARLPRRSRTCTEVRPLLLRRPKRVRGSSVLTPLIAVLTAAAMAVIAQFALLAPQTRIATTLESLRLPMTDDEPTRSYGACGDICSADHRCRHVVLRDGLHDGNRVSREILMAAESCH